MIFDNIYNIISGDGKVNDGDGTASHMAERHLESGLKSGLIFGAQLAVACAYCFREPEAVKFHGKGSHMLIMNDLC